MKHMKYGVHFDLLFLGCARCNDPMPEDEECPGFNLRQDMYDAWISHQYKVDLKNRKKVWLEDKP